MISAMAWKLEPRPLRRMPRRTGQAAIASFLSGFESRYRSYPSSWLEIPPGGAFAADRDVSRRQLVRMLRRRARWAAERSECVGDQGTRRFWAAGDPFLVLKMSELFGYGDVDELIEGYAFSRGEAFGNLAHGWHEPKGEFTDGCVLSTGRHDCYLLV
jgi:hypothetical protein